MKLFTLKTSFPLIVTAALALLWTSPAEGLTHAFIWNSDTGMTDLGSLSEGEDSVALGINDSGQVVGYSNVNNVSHPFIWTEATGMVDLGLFEGNLTSAVAINSRGVVTGGSFDGFHSSTFVWKGPRGFVPLPQKGSYNVSGEAINDSNRVAGVRYRAFDEAILWDPNKGIVQLLGFLPGGDSSEARDINNLDHITGWANVLGGAQHLFLWKRSEGMTDLGTPEGAFQAFGEAINDQDEIVGEADLGSGSVFYWSPGTGYKILQTLGAPADYALDISDAGVIVGSCQVPDTSSLHAVLWSNSLSAPQDLGTLPGGTTAFAFGVNNLGQVVGQSDLTANPDRR